MKLFSRVALLLCCATLTRAEDGLPFRSYPLTDQAIGMAIQEGMNAKGRKTALILQDSFQSFSHSMDNSGSTGFSVEVFTPYAWIAQNASWAAKKYQTFSAEDVTEDMWSGLVRVYANPDMPGQVSAKGMVGTSGVDHVIVRSTDKKNFEVLQPVEVVQDAVYAQNAFGAQAEYSTMVALFAMEDVKRISALDKKGEFFIVVIGSTGEEKKFQVKTKHFKRLP